MNKELTPLQVELLLAYSDSPNRKNTNQLVAEHGDQTVYENCKYLQDEGYFTQNMVFQITKSEPPHFFATHTNGSTTPTLTEKGLNAISAHV